MSGILESNTCFRGCCSSDAIHLHLPSSCYSLHSTIARGSESTVFEAKLHGRRVAAKKPVLSTSDALDKYHRQLQLLCKLDHPGLAKLVAAHSWPPNYLFFFEFYEMGSLAHKLHMEEWNPSLHEALVIAYDLAKALCYMHELGVVHRDVKPGNILIDKTFHPHLADFGLASYKQDLKQVSEESWKSSGKPTGGFHKKNMVGTLIYMAPEVLMNGIHTEKSDVYSFAISVNELLTGVVPYTDIRAEAQAHTVLEMSYTEQKLTAAIASEGLRPILAQSGIPTSLLALIQRSWDSTPALRPSFNEIAKELYEIMKDFIKENVKKSLEMLSSSQSSQYQSAPNVLSQFQEELNWFTQGDLASKRVHDGFANMKLWPSFLHESQHYRPTLSWGSFATCGRRENMEDTHFLLPQMCNEKDIHVFGIFDGHRGSAAAEFSVRALPGFLQTFGYTSSPSEALHEAFVNTDVAFRKELASHCTFRRVTQKDWHPGCTALTSLIVGSKLFVANAGDCRAILCRAGHPFPMSKEHLASCHEERMRVMSEGMEVKWQVNTWRVGPAALEVTRSIGDGDLKPAVTAEPEIIETSLSTADEFLVTGRLDGEEKEFVKVMRISSKEDPTWLALSSHDITLTVMGSDGLWDVMSNEEVISIVRDTVKEPSMCSKRLSTVATERGSVDNITVIVVFLLPVSTAERVY